MFCTLEKKKKKKKIMSIFKRITQIRKVIILMITNGEKQNYPAVKKLLHY